MRVTGPILFPGKPVGEFRRFFLVGLAWGLMILQVGSVHSGELIYSWLQWGEELKFFILSKPFGYPVILGDRLGVARDFPWYFPILNEELVF